MAEKPAPTITAESAPYWEAANRGELVVQMCVTTGKYFFPPRVYSPFVAGGATTWERVSGRGTLYSYVINHRPVPGFEDEVPYVIAVVELAEGPRLMTNLVDVPATPEDLPLDLPLEVRFESRGSQQLPVFAPRRTGGR